MVKIAQNKPLSFFDGSLAAQTQHRAVRYHVPIVMMMMMMMMVSITGKITKNANLGEVFFFLFFPLELITASTRIERKNMLGRWNFPSQLREGKTPQTQPSVEAKVKGICTAPHSEGQLQRPSTFLSFYGTGIGF